MTAHKYAKPARVGANFSLTFESGLGRSSGQVRLRSQSPPDSEYQRDQRLSQKLDSVFGGNRAEISAGSGARSRSVAERLRNFLDESVEDAAR